MVGIKDFEMPKSCFECELNNHYFCDIKGIRIEVWWANRQRAKDCPLVEAIPKADYEIRLKAEKIVMLKDLQSEIEKMQSVHCDYHGDWCVDRDKVWDAIQQKINVIKEQEDES